MTAAVAGCSRAGRRARSPARRARARRRRLSARSIRPRGRARAEEGDRCATRRRLDGRERGRLRLDRRGRDRCGASTPATSASVACTSRRSCSTQRGQLRRWTSRRGSSRSGSAPSMRSEIWRSARSHQPLPGSAATVRRSSLRARARDSASSLLVDAEPHGDLRGAAVPASATSASAVRSRSASAGSAAATSVTAAASEIGASGRPGTGRSGARSIARRSIDSGSGYSAVPGRPVGMADYAKDVLVDTQWVEDHLERRLHPHRRGGREPRALRGGPHPGRDRVRLEARPAGPGQARLPRPGRVRRAVRQPRASPTSTRSCSTATATTGSPPTPTGT